MSKSDLEELGEDTEELAEGFSKYADELKALTGFDIMIDQTHFKDIYDIMDGIAQKWDDLSDTTQARVAEILGGTRQLQVISSVINNWKDATSAYETAINSAGAATEANAKYLDSLEGRMGQLTATFQEFSTNALNTGAFKSVLSLATNVVDVLSKIVGNIHLLIPAIAAVVSFIKSQKNVGRGKLLPFINSGKMPTVIAFYFDRDSFAFAPAENTAG